MQKRGSRAQGNNGIVVREYPLVPHKGRSCGDKLWDLLEIRRMLVCNSCMRGLEKLEGSAHKHPTSQGPL
jgi:hypothetical protein